MQAVIIGVPGRPSWQAAVGLPLPSRIMGVAHIRFLQKGRRADSSDIRSLLAHDSGAAPQKGMPLPLPCLSSHKDCDL